MRRLQAPDVGDSVHLQRTFSKESGAAWRRCGPRLAALQPCSAPADGERACRPLSSLTGCARAPASPCAAYDPSRPLSAQGSTGSLDASPSAFAAATAAAGAAALLPPSAIYASSCRAFTWPLLAPQSQVQGGRGVW